MFVLDADGNCKQRWNGRNLYSDNEESSGQRCIFNKFKAGLDWLAGRGIVNLSSMEDDGIQLAAGDQQEGEDLDRTTEVLKDLLAETAAYRAYFARAETIKLITPTTD